MKPTAEWEKEFDKIYYFDNGVFLERIPLKNGTTIQKTAFSIKSFISQLLEEQKAKEFTKGFDEAEELCRQSLSDQKKELFLDMAVEIKKFRKTHAGYAALSAAWREIQSKQHVKGVSNDRQ